MTSKKIFSLLLKASVVISVIIGLSFSIGGGAFMGGATTLLYFTIQSNIWIGAICLVFLILEILELKTSKSLKKEWLYIIKFMFTVAITLTFLVFAFLLTPQLLTVFPEYLATPGNICCHYLTPILAIIDFVLFDIKWNSKWYHSFYATVMPLYYLVFSMLCSTNGVIFDEAGSTVPYFFLNYETLGWLTVSSDGIGVVYWIFIILILVIGMGFGFYAINKAMKKSRFAQIV